ncbi:MAG: GAF domain-containing protein [Cyanobium sp. M30B3]|nr:MAG: GAF domain-containing protein [Cyanobium sp. M30B3]
MSRPSPLNPEELARQESVLVDILGVATALSGATDLPTLLHLILTTSRQLTNSDAGSIFLVERADARRDPEGEDQLWFAVSQNDSLQRPGMEQELLDIRFPLSPERLVGWCAISGEVLNIPDVYQLDPALPYRFDRSVDQRLGYRAVSMLTLPLRSTSGEIVGVMQLINRKRDARARITPARATELVRPYDGNDQRLIDALASQAAVCVERTQLVESQERLIDAIIAILAGAIDAKSAYTGGHCKRVPELGLMLAEAAAAATSGPLAEFGFADEDAWRAFRIGAWLHDCGKVTTPEYVVDKATKLETLYNRIHEIRTRFEVLLRDAEIERLQGLLAGGDPEHLAARYEARRSQLQDDFAFVAASNLGGEWFDSAKLERLQQIAQQTWQRHFDDTLGLAWEEHERRTDGGRRPDGRLPVTEPLLADKPWHRIPRPPQQVPDPRHGFRMQVPELLYNLGELTNLSVPRGTLTEEERYKINDHIVQTILMLEGLPFPRKLARVAEIAGAHHETLDGRGYPRKLTAEQLSIPARILAIADIFEALTAADRPYKRAKTLSESIEILAGFRDRQHIDPDLFELFLRSGVYRRYAEAFLKPEQIDAVDIERYLSPPPA